jgi:hypothetical protein
MVEIILSIYVHSRSFKGSDDPGKPLKDRWPFYMDSTQETGGNETRPKNIYVNFIIKAKHITLNQQWITGRIAVPILLSKLAGILMSENPPYLRRADELV